MAFTGVAVRQGNSTRYGVDSVGSTPRAFVSFNGEPYVIARNGLIHITDLENGSGVLIQNNANYNLSAPDPTCGFAYNSRLYFLDRGGNTLQIFNDPLTGDVSLIDFYTGITTPAGAATDGTTVWVYDSTFDALHTINPNTAATTLLGTVGFDVTTPSNNIAGIFYSDGKLYLLDNGTELMFVIDDPSAATLEATTVDVSITEFGAGQRGVNGGAVHDGEAYMAGGNPDALYRFYNVRWDETIAEIEVDAGGNGSLDLSTVSKDATSFVFVPGYTAPSWLTISGTELVITNAPGVTADTDFSPEVRAVRGNKHEDETLTVRVIAEAAPPPPPVTVPLALPNFRVTGKGATYIDVAWDQGDNGGAAITDHEVNIEEGDVPGTTWNATGSTSRTHRFSNLKKGTEYTCQARAINSEGEGAASASVMTTTEATKPDAPTQLVPDTIGITDATFSWQNGGDGGSVVTGHQYRIQEGTTAGGTWQPTGSTDTELILSGLMPSTQYTAQVRTLNDEGESLPSNAVTFTTQVYVPTPPVWQTGNALRRTISAGETVTVDIGRLVPNADKVEEVFGLQFQWMDYNEATQMLVLTDALIVREDTEIKIRFLASNTDGDTPADYIITLNGSVLASLHNTLFFEEPLNYEPGRVQRRNTNTVVTELTDNDKTTFSTHTDFDIDMADAQGNATAFDYVCIIAKGQNIRYSITPTGGSGTGLRNRRIEETIKNIGGGTVKTVVNSFTYELYPLPTRVTATSVRLQISGTNLEVYAVMLLKLGWELDANSEFIEMQFDRVDRSGNLTEFPDGTIERGKVLGAEGFKWEGQFTVVVKGSEVDEWMDWTETNINCAFAREPSRHPQDIFLAFFPTLEMPNGYLGLVKSIGETIQFGVAEQ